MKINSHAAFFKNEDIPFSIFNPQSGESYEGWKKTFTGKNWEIKQIEISYQDTETIMEYLADDQLIHAER